MDEQDHTKTDRPWRYALPARVEATLEKLIAESDRLNWTSIFASNWLYLVIDEHYRVSIRDREAIPAGSFSVSLGSLGLDAWAVELGDGPKRAAIEIAAKRALAKFERPEWWVA